MSLISRLNPSEGIADFWSEFRKPNPYRWPVLGASLCITGTLMFLIIREDVVGPPVAPEVTYVTSFKPDRTDEEIIASNKINQERKEQREAYIAEREERKKEIYRALARASGMDPRKIERDAAEQFAAEQAAEAKRRTDILKRREDAEKAEFAKAQADKAQAEKTETEKAPAEKAPTPAQ